MRLLQPTTKVLTTESVASQAIIITERRSEPKPEICALQKSKHRPTTITASFQNDSHVFRQRSYSFHNLLNYCAAITAASQSQLIARLKCRWVCLPPAKTILEEKSNNPLHYSALQET